MVKIPIFITVFDKLTVLKQAVESYYNNISTPFEIIIHDNGTTYQPTLDYIKSQGFKYYKSENKPTAVKESIKDWYKTNDSPYYIVTDPDISLEGVNNDLLELSVHLLEINKEVICVGTALRLKDLPNHYPFKQRVIKWEAQWYKDKHVVLWKDKGYVYHNSTIDSTFAMYRKDFTFNKPNKKAIRLLEPYAAKHLDWYMDHNNLTEDYKYYINSSKCSNRTHWSSKETAH